MLVYEKKVNGVRHLFGTKANVPADADQPLVYKDAAGAEIAPALTDKLVDGNGTNGIQRIKDETLNKNVSVYIAGEASPIIGDAPVVAAKVAPVKAAPVKAVKAEEKKVEEKVEAKVETKAEAKKEEKKADK